MDSKDSMRLFKEKAAPFCVLLALIFSVIIAAIVYWNYTEFPMIDVSQMDIDVSSIRFYIDNIKSDEGYLNVDGWAVGAEPIQYANSRVALRRLTDGCVFQMKTGMTNRGDLPDALSIERANLGGFHACVHLNKLDKDALYQLLLLYRNNGENILVDTGIQINAQGE